MNNKDIDPRVFRQRLVIEGHFAASLDADDIKSYLNRLSEIAKMTVFTGPYCWPPDEQSRPNVDLEDLNGFIAWKESGCHVYAFAKTSFFTADMYSCKPFDIDEVVNYTREFIRSEDLTWREV